MNHSHSPSLVVKARCLSIIFIFLAAIAAEKGHASGTPAQLLFERLAGVPLLNNDPRLATMTDLLSKGKYLDAAHIATEDNYFYNLTLKYWASLISNKDETPYQGLNDFQAFVIGSVRDDLDARLLLTGNFLYQGTDSNLPKVSHDNNDHFTALDTQRADLKTSLVKVAPQWSDIADAGGLLTTRGWAEAHFNAGTNRRAVEYTFREFLCTPIAQWKDIGMPEYRVRRDIDRAPGGNAATYQTLCRTCHAAMDGMAGAFARFDFINGGLQYMGTNAVASKMNRNGNVYPDGYYTVDDSWINFATVDQNAAFGWKGALKGVGVAEFGNMIANADGFGACMTKRVFKQVCQRDPADGDLNTVTNLATNFMQNGYKLRALFEQVATSPQCLGLGQTAF